MPSLQPFPIFGPKKKYHTQDQEKANWFSISDEITKINQGSWTMRCNETQGKNQNAIFSDKSPWNHLSIKLGFWFWYFAIRHSHLTITQEVSSTKLWAKTIILHFRCYCLDSWTLGQNFGHITEADMKNVADQGCIFCLTCSHPEMTEDHVLTSAYVKFFRTVMRNAVNKSVWRKKIVLDLL